MEEWIKPKSVDDVMLAFPAEVVGTLLPPKDVIPDDYDGVSDFKQLQARWFHKGLGKEDIAHLKPKDGVDPELAWRHLSACQRSFEPKHEHKAAGVAWLMSLWFERVE